ncbi:DUF948 domain-containing protein [Leptolyngbya sp. PCC 6406]|uniref:DUF948 domain-containing protein n=1 Tax=Leptolyngbya sp. PCC 6406 TaxID=1173264 RepID=UPI0002ACAE85|nr:DUF948 domain-containing protein [Leptolyngbya sp. PCC 6406]
MIDPLFWLGLSFLLVAVSLTAVLLVLLPAVQELSRAARSVEKLCDTISRELPPTLESIRLTSLEITELTDDVNTGVQQAGRVVKQVDQSLSTVRQQTQRVQVGTRSLMAGVRAAWGTLTRSQKSPRETNRDGLRPASGLRRRLNANTAPPMDRFQQTRPTTAQLPAGPSSAPEETQGEADWPEEWPVEGRSDDTASPPQLATERSRSGEPRSPE